MLFHESVEYSRIRIYRNYCSTKDGQNDDDNDKLRFVDSTDYIYPINRTHLVYFSIDNPVKLGSSFRTITTMDRNKTKKYYNLPFVSIDVHSKRRLIEKDGDVVKIKISSRRKSREVNHKYFKKDISVVTIKFNLSTGNFRVTTYEKTKKKPTVIHRVNGFWNLTQSMKEIIGFKPGVDGHGFNKQKFLNEISKLFGFNTISDGVDFVENYLPLFIRLKNIKVPNNPEKLIMEYYPTEKYLKKNDRKLVASSLDRFGIKNKTFIKYVHQNHNANLYMLFNIHQIFGEKYTKYFSMFSDETIRSLSNMMVYGDKKTMELKKGKFLPFSDGEKKCIFQIINDWGVMIKISRNNILDLFFDHYQMMCRLKEYYPDLSISATTYRTFIESHNDLSKKEQNINRGYEYQIVYPTELIKSIEVPIVIDGNEYQPKVLTSDQEYDEEGMVMHHCVGGYITKENSMIVSLRCGNHRVTNEYDLSFRNLIQSRYYSNSESPDHFKMPLELLHQRVKNHPKSIRPIERKKTPLVINGKAVVKDNNNEDFFNDLPIENMVNVF